MLNWVRYIKTWLRAQDGQDLAEYALLIGLIALVAVLAVTAIGLDVKGIFEAISTELGEVVIAPEG